MPHFTVAPQIVRGTDLALFLRRPAPVTAVQAGASAPVMKSARFLGRSDPAHPLGQTPRRLQMLLCVAGVSCCVAMSMPQVHIVAYCADLGYGAARGAEMLSLMLACGIVSRLISGAICDRIGGLRTLLLDCVNLDWSGISPAIPMPASRTDGVAPSRV